MNTLTPDDHIEYLSHNILTEIHSGRVTLPEDVPQIAALRARVAELESELGVLLDERKALIRECLTTKSPSSLRLSSQYWSGCSMMKRSPQAPAIWPPPSTALPRFLRGNK